MKKLLPILLSFLLFFSCSDPTTDKPNGEVPDGEVPDVEVKIGIDVSNITAPSSEAGSSIVKLTSSAAWSTSIITDKNDGAWIDVTPKSGAAGSVDLVITFTANTSLTVRSASVKVSAGTVSKTITVNQPGVSNYLLIDKLENNTDSATGVFDVSVTSNGSWTVTEIPSWLTVTPNSGSGDGVVKVEYQQNKEQLSRKATIVFVCGTEKQSLVITQLGLEPSLVISPTTEQKVSEIKGTTPISVTSNTSWTVTSDKEWVTLSASNGTGNASIDVNYEANMTTSARTAVVTFKSGTIEKTVTITQSGVNETFYIDQPSSQSVGDIYGFISVKITSNGSWAVTSNQNWVSFSLLEGTGDATTNVIYEANTTTSARTAVVTFKSGTIEKTVTITQSGAVEHLFIDPSVSSSVNSEKGTFKISVASNSTWNVSSDQEWLTLSASNGTGDAVLDVNYLANTSTTQRFATVTFKSSSETTSIVIYQNEAGEILSIDPSNSSYSLNADPKDIPIKVTSNTSWSVSSSESNWATVDKFDGIGDGLVTISVAENNYNSDRKCIIKFYTTSGKTVDVEIKQKAKQLDDFGREDL